MGVSEVILSRETVANRRHVSSMGELRHVVCKAENGCFVMQALLNPVPVSSTVALNGGGLDVAAYPPPAAAPARSR